MIDPRPRIYGIFIRSSNAGHRANGVVHLNRDRLDVFADEVIETWDDSASLFENWNFNDEPRERIDYVWIQYDLDYIDDIDLPRRFVDTDGTKAYYVRRLEMWDGRLYNAATTSMRPQLIPYRDEATWHYSQPPIPKYAYDLPYIKEPAITILDFYRYDKNYRYIDIGENERRATALREWPNSVPYFATADNDGTRGIGRAV